jgi:hypothetical protein
MLTCGHDLEGGGGGLAIPTAGPLMKNQTWKISCQYPFIGKIHLSAKCVLYNVKNKKSLLLGPDICTTQYSQLITDNINLAIVSRAGTVQFAQMPRVSCDSLPVDSCGTRAAAGSANATPVRTTTGVKLRHIRRNNFASTRVSLSSALSLSPPFLQSSLSLSLFPLSPELSLSLYLSIYTYLAWSCSFWFPSLIGGIFSIRSITIVIWSLVNRSFTTSIRSITLPSYC